ncbi:hypothetical protein G6F24_014636 [Rhizopus arrhizus]|nr:hypothetical protein G6F24_014636 [Rhizopus arrhizus]
MIRAAGAPAPGCRHRAGAPGDERVPCVRVRPAVCQQIAQGEHRLRIDQLQLYRKRHLRLQRPRPAPVAHRRHLLARVFTQLLCRALQRGVPGPAPLRAQLVAAQHAQLRRLPGQQRGGDHRHQRHHQHRHDHRHATLAGARHRTHPGCHRRASQLPGADVRIAGLAARRAVRAQREHIDGAVGAGNLGVTGIAPPPCGGVTSAFSPCSAVG